MADLQFGHFGGELTGELVIHRVVHVEAVNADAGLARVAVFGRDGAFDGGINVSVGKHNKRRVAAQFQRDPFLMVSAHWLISKRPMGVEPVKLNLRTSGWPVSCAPMAGASPVTMFNTLPGCLHRCASSARASAENGVSLAGLTTMVHPAASAGATLRVIIAAGKYSTA